MEERRYGFFYAYTFKWKAGKKAYFFAAFMGNYAVKAAEVVTSENFESFGEMVKQPSR